MIMSLLPHKSKRIISRSRVRIELGVVNMSAIMLITVRLCNSMIM